MIVAANVSQVNIGAAGLRSLLDASSCPRLKTLILVKTGRVNDHCLKVRSCLGDTLYYCHKILSFGLHFSSLWRCLCCWSCAENDVRRPQRWCVHAHCAVGVNGAQREQSPACPHVLAAGYRAWFAAIDVLYSGSVPSHAFYGQVRAGDMHRAYQPRGLHPTWPHRAAKGTVDLAISV